MAYDVLSTMLHCLYNLKPLKPYRFVILAQFHIVNHHEMLFRYNFNFAWQLYFPNVLFSHIVIGGGRSKILGPIVAYIPALTMFFQWLAVSGCAEYNLVYPDSSKSGDLGQESHEEKKFPSMVHPFHKSFLKI